MFIAMNSVPGVDETVRQWSVCSGREPLLTTLREAAARAAQLKHSVLASFTQPVERYDTIRVFSASRRAGLGDSFFWEQPAKQCALIGVGAATSIEMNGSTSIIDAATAWRMLLQDAVIMYTPEVEPAYGSGPALFGGFAFDPLGPHTRLWEGFPGGLLILPHLLLSYHAGNVSLTLNAIVQEGDDIELCAQEITARARHLLTIVEQTPAPTVEETRVHLSMQDVRPAEEWKRLVATTVERLQQGVYEKVVLARSVEVTPADAADSFDVSATLQRLKQSYPGAYVFAIQRGGRCFVGATPERLVQAQDGRIQTMALAGSAPRGMTEEEDARIGAELLQSKKNNFEHASVVAMVRKALMAHCTNVFVSDMPQLLKLKNIQHLETPIIGELLPGCCILDVMADLHPTPAVGGFPRLEALVAIRETEALDRGWYAGPVGWIGASGHGEFAVALRSGLIEEKQATLFAGCGIVADSNPQSEYEESCLKLQVMLRGLGGTC